MDSFTLKLVFSGLMAYVSHAPVEEMTILLPVHEKHVAKIFVESNRLDTQNTTLHFENDITRQGIMGATLPGGYDLQVAEPAAEPSLRYDRCNRMQPGAVDKFLFGKRVCQFSLAELMPTVKAVKGDCLTAVPGSCCTDLQMRIRLTQGKIRPRQFSPVRPTLLNSRELTWIQGGPEKFNWVPEAMVLTQKIEGNGVTIDLKPWKNGERAHRIVLKDVPSKEKLNIRIDYSPSLDDFCNCNKITKVCQPDFDPKHLQHLAVFAEGCGHTQDFFIELSSIGAKHAVQVACDDHINGRARGGEPVICYGSQIP